MEGANVRCGSQGAVEIIFNSLLDGGMETSIDGPLWIHGNLISTSESWGLGISGYNNNTRIDWNYIDSYNFPTASLGLFDSARVQIIANTFVTHSDGILFSGWQSQGAMHLNNFVTDEIAGDYLLAIDTGDFSATWNYWGSAATAEIEEVGEQGDLCFILDGHDNPQYPIVDLSQWQHEPLPLEEAPLTRITEPLDGTGVSGARMTLAGYALAPEGVDRVDVSADGGQTWVEAAYVEPDMKELWTWLWFAPGDGTYTLRSRVVTGGEIVEKPGGAVTVTVSGAAPVPGDLNRDGTADATE
jgi:hypothetical protein